MLSGRVALWEKHWAEAEAFFKEVVSEEPNNFAARNYLAMALVEQNDPAKKSNAQKLAFKNYEADKQNVDAISTLCWVYYRNGDFNARPIDNG